MPSHVPATSVEWNKHRNRNAPVRRNLKATLAGVTVAGLASMVRLIDQLAL
jgi:hypothetical protein